MARNYLHSLLGDQEEILLVSRQHWFVLFRMILLELIAILILVVILVIAQPLLPEIPIGYGYFLLVLPLISIAREFMIWWNRQIVITNRRVIQLSGIINKNVIDSSLEKVNDVKMVQSFWGRLFRYGNVEILTASEMGANLFKKIGNPIRFKTTMLNAKSRLELEQAGGFVEKLSAIDVSEPTANDVPALIERLGALREKGILTQEEFEKKKAELLEKL